MPAGVILDAIPTTFKPKRHMPLTCKKKKRGGTTIGLLIDLPTYDCGQILHFLTLPGWELTNID